MKKITRKIEIEQWSEACNNCGKLIVGKTESEVIANMNFHQLSNKCKNAKDVQSVPKGVNER